MMGYSYLGGCRQAWVSGVLQIVAVKSAGPEYLLVWLLTVWGVAMCLPAGQMCWCNSTWTICLGGKLDKLNPTKLKMLSNANIYFF